ncbi:hypothetical protein J2X31_000485 [Flavobacterium arsenatis]|uniref:Uncharacterized protein n=1 Tax=Flavobacterium arsenatis TaxID=1484332 RepID=A0ABU1TL00_9FLAO|nr:hypothetical protein [Flavobacterium arsenatis]
MLGSQKFIKFQKKKIVNKLPLEDGGRTDKDDRFFGRTTDNC